MNLRTAVGLLLASLAPVRSGDADPSSFLQQNAVSRVNQYEVLQVYQREDPSFIQGLWFDQSEHRLLETTGLYGESKTSWLTIDDEHSVIKMDPSPVAFAAKEFGEGISPINDSQFIELTWKERKVHLLDRQTLEKEETFEMWPEVKEGWGITLDDANRILYVSDGSDKITRVNADTKEVISQFTVKEKSGLSQPYINELEFVDGYIWANVFYMNGMVQIDPTSGTIERTVDFTPLHDAEMARMRKSSGGLRRYDYANNVCNGIAYDFDAKEFYVTGKRWNLMFRLRLTDQD